MTNGIDFFCINTPFRPSLRMKGWMHLGEILTQVPSLLIWRVHFQIDKNFGDSFVVTCNLLFFTQISESYSYYVAMLPNQARNQPHQFQTCRSRLCKTVPDGANFHTARNPKKPQTRIRFVKKKPKKILQTCIISVMRFVTLFMSPNVSFVSTKCFPIFTFTLLTSAWAYAHSAVCLFKSASVVISSSPKFDVLVLLSLSNRLYSMFPSELMWFRHSHVKSPAVILDSFPSEEVIIRRFLF